MTPVVDLDGHVVGRQQELARLEGALEAAGRHGGECVLLSGVPGVGKSTLMHAFGGGVCRRNGVFAYGRYQEGARAPYSALGEALGALVCTMEATSPGERDRWREDLDRGMSSTGGALGALVPGLEAVLGAATEVADLDAANGRYRLQRAVTRLVSITASYRPVVLAVDDLQWADQDSLLLLSQVLTASIRNVVLLVAHRTGEFDPTAMDLTSASLCSIDLEPLSTAELEALLAQVCGRTVELGHVAAEFHHRTGGNPLQIRQLLRQAQREGALMQLGASGRPAWDMRALTSIEITTNVAEFLGRAIDQLRPADSAVLSALACIGREFDLADAAAAAAQPAEMVAQALWSALDLRLLEAIDRRGRRIAQVINREARYRFSHDRVAEAAQARLSDETQREVHLRIGRRLVERGDDGLFEAARHLGIGGLGMEGDDECARFAGVEQRAAQMARLQASFPLALECFRAGLALLGERRWVAHPALARELQLGAAEAAYLVSDATLMEVLLREAEEVLHEPTDRARLACLRLKGQVAQHRLQEALETGLRALDELGESLPRRPGKVQVTSALVRMRLTMRGWSNERLLLLPRCEDRCIIEIQLILVELRNISYTVRPQLFPLIVRRELNLTLAHGLVPNSPAAIASYGVLLATTGDHVGSQRFGEVGLLLADRPEFRDARAQTLFLHVNFIRHWRRPMREGLSQLRDAVQEALDRGDHEYAGFLAAVLLYQSFWVGRPLAEIDALAQSVIPEIRAQRVPSSLCRSTHQLCLNLMGRCDDPFLLAGESGYDERVVLPIARREHDDVAVSAAAITKLGLHFWCGDDAGVLPFAEETARHLGGMTGTPNVQLFHLTNALSRVRDAPGDRSTARAVRRSLALHRSWAAAAPANYAAPCELIEGVWARAQGELRQAERHLDLAIALAEEHQLPLMSALAHEEAGALYAQTGRVSLSEFMVRTAHHRWLSLGMAVRSDWLEHTHPWLLSRGLVQPGSATVDPVGIHRLIQALPAVPTLDGLAEVLLGTVVDTTGAARVLLLTGEGKRLVVRAVREDGVTTMVDGASADVAHDRSIVRDVVRRGRLLVVAADADPGGDHPPRRHEREAAVSVTLAVPVRVRGKTIGVVYAEHHKPVRAFDPGHEEALVALCAQAAAPLWSFELEGRLQEAEEHRESLMDVQSRFISSELLRILDIDDIRRVRCGYQVERRMTVLISDIRGYTALLEGMSVSEASDMTMGFLRAVEVPIITSNGLLQDVRGDEVLAVFDTEPDDAVRAGLAMLRSLREHNRERVAQGSDELRVGIGINTGAVGLGLVGGVNRMALTVIGDAVNLASRVESTNKRYGSNLLISEETYAQLVGRDQFDIRRMERVMVVNRRQPVTIYEMYDEDPEPLRAAKRAAQPAFDEAFARFDAGDAEQARAAFEQCSTLLPDDHIAPLHLAHCEALARGDMAPGQEIALLQK